jgi:hypothetical protein
MRFELWAGHDFQFKDRKYVESGIRVADRDPNTWEIKEEAE